MNMTPSEFVQGTLRMIRASFMGGVSDKQFFQEKRWLEEAITHPASWLRERGGSYVTIKLMRRILTTVVRSIRQHGDQPRRFSIYFLYCVQQHMKHHGDEYLQEAKRTPAASVYIKTAVADLRSASAAADPGAVLAETNRALGRGRRRIRKSKAADSVPDLFERTGIHKPKLNEIG